MALSPSSFRVGQSGAAVAVGPLESDVLDALWTGDKAMSVPEIHQGVTGDGRTLSYSAVKAVLNNLAGKGWLTKTQQGKLTYFEPTMSREGFEAHVMRSVIGSLKRNFGEPVIAQFVDQLAVDDESIEEIERLLAQRKAELGQ
jgi:predicted transcriptional regulator